MSAAFPPFLNVQKSTRMLATIRIYMKGLQMDEAMKQLRKKTFDALFPMSLYADARRQTSLMQKFKMLFWKKVPAYINARDVYVSPPTSRVQLLVFEKDIKEFGANGELYAAASDLFNAPGCFIGEHWFHYVSKQDWDEEGNEQEKFGNGLEKCLKEGKVSEFLKSTYGESDLN